MFIWSTKSVLLELLEGDISGMGRSEQTSMQNDLRVMNNCLSTKDEGA